ncbi:hypothetical protein BKA59DRAFT_546922 [Fusarium tricinctum]|uniref:C2H2-type domain-containing protein n=1 Tax=Fusarium tricinctum TaxID=61284 RepID=A0A8K0RZA1_9HYPO|nr:hypothetical protein BKA59DRAFT_546922 [Fusarium tricinctum]
MIEETSQSVTELGIAPLVARILASFKTLTSTLQYDHAHASQISSSLARFKLWAGNLGAHRKSGSRSLEYRLRDASHIRKLVISLLQDLCRSIEQGTLIANENKSSDTASESHDQVENDLADYFNDDEDFDMSETEKTLDEIAHVIACLLRLSITIRNPAPHDQFLSRAEEGLIESFVHWDAKHVQEKFTNVDKTLADRLGRAMARRRLYFKYRKEHKHRLSQGLDQDEDEQATTVASSLPEHLKEADDTRLDQFGIVDDGCSDTSATSYATSKPDSTQLRVPSIPKEYKDGPFKCPFCQMIVLIETRYAWKKHVFRDLRPYVCLSDACKTPERLYRRRNEWKMHMRREHWKFWHCPFGCDAEFDRAEGFQNHIQTAHRNNMSSDKIRALGELSSRTNAAKAKGQCPLCCDFQVNSENQYEKHIGQHLENLSLFTLPNIGDEGNEDEDEDQAGARDGDDEDDDDDGDDEDVDDEVWLHTDDPEIEAPDMRFEATVIVDRLSSETLERIIHAGGEEKISEVRAKLEEERMTAAAAEGGSQKVETEASTRPDEKMMRLETDIAALKVMEEEEAQKTEKQKEAEQQIRKEAEEAFSRRMEYMRIAQEEAKKEIEKDRLEAEMAARGRMEEEQVREHALAMARAEELARIKFEAEMEADIDLRKAVAEIRNKAEEDAREKFEVDAKVAEGQVKAEAETRK